MVDREGQMHRGVGVFGSLRQGGREMHEQECSIGSGCTFGQRTARYGGCC